jgi:hypothetical protein
MAGSNKITGLTPVLLMLAACTGGIMNVGEPDEKESSDTQTGFPRDTETATHPLTPAPDGGAPATDDSCSDDGVAYASGCWYLGAYGESCDIVCSDKGGYNPLTETVVGTPEQGGSSTACQEIIRKMGFEDEVTTGFRKNSDEGVGCHLWDDGEFWWLYSPEFDPSVCIDAARIVCACLSDD